MKRQRLALLLMAFAFFVGGGLWLGSASVHAVESSLSRFATFSLKHGIMIKIPKHWEILESQLMKQIDTNTEVLTGVGQGDNEILIAANYYDGRSKRAAASARVSVRLKETMSEAAVEAMTQSDLEEIGKVGYQLMMSAMIKSGDSSVRITPHSITKSKLAGYLAIRTDYQEIHPTVTRHTTIYVLHLGDRLVKLTLGYDSPQAFNLRPTINEIINSFQINGRSNYAATQAVQAAQCQPRQPTPQER